MLRIWVLTVFTETDSSLAVSGLERFVGRYRSTRNSLGLADPLTYGPGTYCGCRLAEVPPDVFSEAMRDLDLVVSVSTVANDPIWLEEYHGQPVLDRYWDQIARGSLDQLRVHRRAILAPFCDGQAGGRYQLTDSDLVITQSLATYQIDLATANVPMEPAGKWLSFDTKLTPDPAYNQHML